MLSNVYRVQRLIRTQVRCLLTMLLALLRKCLESQSRLIVAPQGHPVIRALQLGCSSALMHLADQHEQPQSSGILGLLLEVRAAAWGFARNAFHGVPAL